MWCVNLIFRQMDKQLLTKYGRISLADWHHSWVQCRISTDNGLATLSTTVPLAHISAGTSETFIAFGVHIFVSTRIGNWLSSTSKLLWCQRPVRQHKYCGHKYNYRYVKFVAINNRLKWRTYNTRGLTANSNSWRRRHSRQFHCWRMLHERATHSVTNLSSLSRQCDHGDHNGTSIPAQQVVTTTIRFWFECHSTCIQLHFDGTMIILRYGLQGSGLRPK